MEDYQLLIEIIGGYDTVWVTSHCFAEASNLLKQTTGKKAGDLLFCLSELVARCRESHIEKSLLFDKTCFTRLGVADTGFVIKSKRVSCSFTVDLDLYLEVSRSGGKVINSSEATPQTNEP